MLRERERACMKAHVYEFSHLLLLHEESSSLLIFSLVFELKNSFVSTPYEAALKGSLD